MQYVVKIILFLAPRLQLRLVLRQQRNSSTAQLKIFLQPLAAFGGARLPVWGA